MSELIDFVPLEEKIHMIMEDLIPWSMVEVQAAFPNETYWPLYRAWQKLEEQNRITFYRTKGKRKYFQKTSANELPHIKAADGSARPLSVFVESPEIFIDSERWVWTQLDKKFVNKVPLLFGHLFVLATAFKRDEWLEVRKQLMDARTTMATAINWIDSVLDHPAMTGDPDKFKAVFAGKDAPEQSKLHDFLRFVNKRGKS